MLQRREYIKEVVCNFAGIPYCARCAIRFVYFALMFFSVVQQHRPILQAATVASIRRCFPQPTDCEVGEIRLLVRDDLQIDQLSFGDFMLLLLLTGSHDY